MQNAPGVTQRVGNKLDLLHETREKCCVSVSPGRRSTVVDGATRDQRHYSEIQGPCWEVPHYILGLNLEGIGIHFYKSCTS